jgi:hypothetical protein
MNFNNFKDRDKVNELLKSLFYWVLSPFLFGLFIAIMSNGESHSGSGGSYPENYLGIMFLFLIAYICFGVAIVSFIGIFLRFLLDKS